MVIQKSILGCSIIPVNRLFLKIFINNFGFVEYDKG